MSGMQISEDLTKSVGAAVDPEDIKATLIAEVERQATAGAAQAAIDAAAATAAAAAATKAGESRVYTRTETIGGKDFTFEAESEEALDRDILNAYRGAFAVQSSTVEIVSPEAAQAAEIAEQQAAEKRAADKAELELKFKRGEISVKDYLRESGELADYLAEQGISVDKLRETVNAKEQNDNLRTWTEATDYFLKQHANDWPGGTRNLNLMGLKLIQLGLDDAEDKVAAYETAFAALKQDDLLFPPDPTPEEVAAATTTTDESAFATTESPIIREVRPGAGAEVPVRITPSQFTPAQANAARIAAPAPKRPASSSAILGASSGVGAETDRNGGKRPAVTYDISREASPEQILQAWKDAQAKAGVNPDSAWQQHFSRRSA